MTTVMTAMTQKVPSRGVLAKTVAFQPVFFAAQQVDAKPASAQQFPRLLTLLSAVSALLVPAAAQAQAPVGREGTSINEQQVQRVNKASDLPFLTRELKQPVVDLLHHPLLKPETKASLNQLLRELNASGQGQMAVVIIPDTAQKELNSLATDLGNQMGIGQAGQNNGLIYLINAQAVRENREHGKMFVLPGSGAKYQFAKGEAAKLIRDVALPHLKAGNPDAAVDAVTRQLAQKLKAAGAGNVQRLAQNPQQEWTETDIIVAVCLVIVALAVLGLVIAMIAKGNGGNWSSSGGGYSGGGYSGGTSSYSNDSYSSSDFGGGTFDGGGGGGD